MLVSCILFIRLYSSYWFLSSLFWRRSNLRNSQQENGAFFLLLLNAFILLLILSYQNFVNTSLSNLSNQMCNKYCSKCLIRRLYCETILWREKTCDGLLGLSYLFLINFNIPNLHLTVVLLLTSYVLNLIIWNLMNQFVFWFF